MRKNIKRGLAVTLAMLLMIPTQPVLAIQPEVSQTQEQEKAPEEERQEDDSQEETSEEAASEQTQEEISEEGASEQTEEENSQEEASEEEGAQEEELKEENSEEEAPAEEESQEENTEESKPETETEQEEQEENPVWEDDSQSETAADSSQETADNSQAEQPDQVVKEEVEEEPEEESAKEEPEEEPQEEAEEATPDSADEIEEVRFNTGNYEVRVVNEEDFYQYETGDAFFDADGSYTIQIPEANPFFPYEVEFTYDGEVTQEWFMTPDDSVEIGGYTFYVSAYFDDTAVTQMTLNVAGEPVVVYPEEKDFTKGSGVMPMSMLPLEEQRLTVDLTQYSPVELTMVSFDSIFTGDVKLSPEDKVMWAYNNNSDASDYSDIHGEDFTVSSVGDRIDLSYGNYTTWQMIVGDESQLAAENIRYIITVNTETDDWLIPSVAIQKEDGTRRMVEGVDGDYSAYYGNSSRRFYIEGEDQQLLEDEQFYVGLAFNEALYPETSMDALKVYEGAFDTAEEAEQAPDITSQILPADMNQKDGGYAAEPYDDREVTFVSYSGGQVTGCLPVKLNLQMNDSIHEYEEPNNLNLRLYRDGISQGSSSRVYVSEYTEEELAVELPFGYRADGVYPLTAEYEKNNQSGPEGITAAYLGQFDSIGEAQAAGAQEIKEQLFGTEGYAANYSQGVSITVFAGADGDANQEVYRFTLRTEEKQVALSNSVLVQFTGLVDREGEPIDCYALHPEEDSYGEYNYQTILVMDDVDLSEVAPEFTIEDGLNLYAEGSSSPEISGESFHDFSNGPVQYTASAENKENSRNYWLCILKPDEQENHLYINSLNAQEAETTADESGVIHSQREVMLDGRHDDRHDIVLINQGKTAIEKIQVELVSDTVELDEYWTLNGSDSLEGFFTVDDSVSNYGELPNLAKIRLKAKEGAEGQDVEGTLTIKSGETVLIVLALTGTVGDPMIITDEIPEAVKYVPYGTMIQNNNKYSWNQVSYTQIGGRLPAGMEIKPNGEIYGVPTEAGEFTFRVEMENSAEGFTSSWKTFTLVVKENTDANVDGATDAGYEVTQRIPDITLRSTEDHTFVSQGVYGEFVDIFLDGMKLVEGVDYNSESGSTRITIRSQTLKASNSVGTHTLGVEFRTQENNTLKRAAQNYRVVSSNTGDGDSGRDIGISNATANTTTRDAKKGYVNTQTGIITGTGTGYSRWQQDETGWKLIYADGTAACGSMAEQADGTTAEQVLWEKVNGSWYAFGADGYLKSGWICDYQLSAWYNMSIDSGMRSGWYSDPQDGCTYYLDPESGKLVVGWKLIEGKWYYFSDIIQTPTWYFDERTGAWVYNIFSTNKPYGSMYKGGRTPDNYYVGEDGAWDGQSNGQ